MAVVLGIRPPNISWSELFSILLSRGRGGLFWSPSLLLGNLGEGGGLGRLNSRHSWSSILWWRLCLASDLLKWLISIKSKWFILWGGCNVCFILPTHLFLHTTYLAKSFKPCKNIVYVYKSRVSIKLHVCDICFVHLLFCMPVIYLLLSFVFSFLACALIVLYAWSVICQMLILYTLFSRNTSSSELMLYVTYIRH